MLDKLPCFPGIEGPAENCPKCNKMNSWQRPIYEHFELDSYYYDREAGIADGLRWVCSHCGYDMITLTFEACAVEGEHEGG